MNKLTTIVLFGAVFAVSMAGVTAAMAIATPLSVGAVTPGPMSNGVYFLGHVTLTATDADGNVFAYIQTDNHLTNRGENCIAESIFNLDGTGSGDSCGGTTAGTLATGGYRFIEIGTENTTPSQAFNGVQTRTAISTTQTPGFTQQASANAGSSQAIVTLSNTFNNVNAIIRESAVVDADGGNSLAYQEFNPITLGASDNLTVDWVFTIGSTTPDAGV